MSLDKQLDRVVSGFVSDLTKIVAAATREEVKEAIRKALGAADGGRRGPGRPPKAAAAGGRGRQKRSSRQMAAQQSKLQGYIKANAGQRMEQIVKGMGLETRLLQPLIKRLVADKKIKAKGKARGTTYTTS